MYFLACLSDVTTKENGKLSSYSHMFKFYHVVKYGLLVANKIFTVDFYSKVGAVIFCYKKEFTDVKKEGNTYAK